MRLRTLVGKPPSSPPASVTQLPQPWQPQPPLAAARGAPDPLAAEGEARSAALSTLKSLIEAPETPPALARELQNVRLLLGGAEAAAAAIARSEVSEARSEVSAHEVEVVNLELQLKELVTDYLSVQGSLDARGMMEFAEQRLPPPQLFGRRLDRKSLWEAICKRDPSLVESILMANPRWKAVWIPDEAVALYSNLTAWMDTSDIKASGSRVLLVEGYLSQEQVRFLQRMAEAVHCRYEVRFLQLPYAITQDE